MITNQLNPNTMEIQKTTIDKAVYVLNEMKRRIDFHQPMNLHLITKSAQTSRMVPAGAILVGFFEKNAAGIWKCNKTHFEPADARIVIEAIHNTYPPSSYKRNKAGQTTAQSCAESYTLDGIMNWLKNNGYNAKISKIQSWEI